MNGNETEQMENRQTSWEDLSISNDFLFGKVMQNPELCKELLQRILPDLEIERIEYPELQKSIKQDIDAKSVRLDVYVKDEKEVIYDIEMQVSDTKELPKKSRNYQSMIDLQLIDKGQYYDELNRSAHKFDKNSGLKPIIGTMACESINRRSQWLKYGCNSFDAKNPASKPISFWREQDVLEYIVKYDIPYPSVYGDIKQDKNGKYFTTGLERTGCVFCGFGCHIEKEPNRFQRLKKTHPKLYEYCMKPVEDGGLGMREVLEYIGVKIE